MNACKLLKRAGLFCGSWKEHRLCSRRLRGPSYVQSCPYATYQLTYLKLPPGFFTPFAEEAWRPQQPPSMRES